MSGPGVSYVNGVHSHETVLSNCAPEYEQTQKLEDLESVAPVLHLSSGDSVAQDEEEIDIDIDGSDCDESTSTVALGKSEKCGVQILLP